MWQRLEAIAIRCLLMMAVVIIAINLLALMLHFPACFGLIVIVTGWRRMRGRYLGGDAYGSARLATLADLWRNNLLSDDGIVLGDCGYMQRPTRREGVRALFSMLPSPIACRLFLAAFFGRKWMER